MTRSKISAAHARNLFYYNKKTGELLWKSTRAPRAQAGAVAGSPNGKGYIKVQIDGVLYFAHRLVWLIHHGCWPERQIDHINGCRADNRVENLRAATNAENQQNKAVHKSSTSRFLGVSRVTRLGMWQAQIMLNRTARHLGYFTTEDEAAAAYAAAKAEMHAFNPVHRSHVVERGI